MHPPSPPKQRADAAKIHASAPTKENNQVAKINGRTINFGAKRLSAGFTRPTETPLSRSSGGAAKPNANDLRPASSFALAQKRKKRSTPDRMRYNAKDDLLDLSSALFNLLRHSASTSADEYIEKGKWNGDLTAVRTVIEGELERTYGPLPGQLIELTKMVEEWRDRHGVVSEWAVYALLHIAVRYSVAAPTGFEALLPFNAAISKLTRRIKQAKERADDNWSNVTGITSPVPWR